MSQRPVAVVGAGWAGIAAAVALTTAGRKVLLFEAGPQAGGRARTAPAFDLDVDNGQHLAIGAYRDTLKLMATVGADPDAFARLPLVLEQRDASGPRFALRAPVGAGRLRLGLAFAAMRGLSAGEKIALLRGWRQLLTPDDDATVARALLEARQPATAIRFLWNPLCIATLNTDPEVASAAVFAAVLRESLAAPTAGANDLLLPARALGAVLPSPALAWLSEHGAKVHLGERVTGIAVADRVTAISTQSGAHAVDGLVLAVPPAACARLLAPLHAEADLVTRIGAIEESPICTVYLRYSPATRVDPPLLGCDGTLTQWIVDRRVAGQPGVLAAIVSAAGEHMSWSRAQLAEQVVKDINAVLPGLGKPEAVQVIREKRATFAATPAVERLRPAVDAASTRGVSLAGDWTATGLPATLEGAVRSGYSAAQHLMEHC